MLKQINFNRFKSLHENSIGLGKITILAGLNSAGKSSVIQGLLLTRSLADFIRLRGVPENNTIDNFELNGTYLLSLGSPGETITKGAGKDFSIGLVEGDKKFDNRFYLNEAFSDEVYNMSVEVSKDFEKTEIYNKDFYYLNAERLGPRIRHWVNEKGGRLNCGFRGEYTIEVLARTKGEKAGNEYIVEDAKILGGKKLDGFQTIPKYTVPWMEFITPNSNIGDAEIIGRIRSSLITLNGNTPPNVGFGISYVLPIVVTGLLAKPGSIMVVENPEAHLHPKGQSNIGFFLGQMASAGVQIIVETHSEHVVNGIRKASLTFNNDLEASTVKTSFFEGIDDNKHASVLPIDLLPNGDLTSFPVDFFDQVRQDLAELRSLAVKEN